jgi:hypothetical protein
MQIDQAVTEPEAAQTKEEADNITVEGDALPFPPHDEPSEVFDAEPALEHFRILIKFMENYFSEQLTLKEQIKAGIEEKIDFENLWILFEVNSTIFAPYREGGQVLANGASPADRHTASPRDMPQAYRVTATMGCVPFQKSVSSKTEKGNAQKSQSLSLRDMFSDTQDIPDSQRTRNRYSSLFVYCFYIDFDGSRYGVVTEIFVFRPHEGKIDIRSLDAYPLQYAHPGPAKILSNRDTGNIQWLKNDELTRRGERFIDLTAVSHLSYEGMTVGERREEVNLGSI